MSWRLAPLAAGLLLATATTFAVGVAVERGGHREATASPHAEASGGEADNDAEAQGAHEAAVRSEGGEAQVLGIDGESTAVVVAVGLASLLLAGLLLARPSPAVWGVTVAFTLVLAVFDIAEVAHQLGRSDGGLAALASVIALGHAAIAILIGRQASTTWPDRSIAPPTSSQ